MRNSVAAIALIQTHENGRRQWLARWNHQWRAFSFVGGHKEDGETFRECLVREVIEELGLIPEADFIIADTPHSHLEYTAWSDGARAQTAYTMELFPLDLIGDFSEETIAGDPENRWLTPEEIKASITQDGKPISGTMGLLLQMANLLDDPPPDSGNSPS